jgi:hypothetical protein
MICLTYISIEINANSVDMSNALKRKSLLTFDFEFGIMLPITCYR